MFYYYADYTGGGWFDITFEDTNHVSIEEVTLTNTLDTVVRMYGGSNNKISRSNIISTASSVGGVWDSKNEKAMYSDLEYHNIPTLMEGCDNQISIYNKVIDNFVTSDEAGFKWYEYRVRECQPNTKNVIIDWYFDKNNTFQIKN